MKRCILRLILLVVLLLSNSLYSQTFTTTPFITMPGDNTGIDVVSDIENHFSNPTKAFICWVNKLDSVYTLYLKQTSPDTGKNILVFSDSQQIANPNIAFIGYSDYNNIRIAWQSFVNNHWQILSREYSNDSLTNIISITDSLEDNVSPGLNMFSIAWIQSGNLVYKYFNSLNAKPRIFDSIDCSNPKVLKSTSDFTTLDIVYEKGPVGNKQIIEGRYGCCSGSKEIWIFDKISNGGNNINPRFGTGYGGISYQKFENGVWKSVCQIWLYDTTINISYNCQNPTSFAYPILTKKTSLLTPFFTIYDSDSLANNKEIIYKTKYYSDSVRNLSNSAGDDYLPYISFLKLLDTTYIAIFWTHDQNGKKDIWMAYSKYNPDFGAVEDPGETANNFVLKQNYPNPFNPSTIISWHLVKGSLVTLKIYDILGNEITTLINEFQYAGEHSITFDTQQAIDFRLSSGIYFYQLRAGNNIMTKKMIYLK